jgi:hypothetical protein
MKLDRQRPYYRPLGANRAAKCRKCFSFQELQISGSCCGEGDGQPRELHRVRTNPPKLYTKDTDFGLMIAGQYRGKEGTDYWRCNRFRMPFDTMPPGTPTETLLRVCAFGRRDHGALGFFLESNRLQPRIPQSNRSIYKRRVKSWSLITSSRLESPMPPKAT